MSTPYTLEWALEERMNMDSWLQVNNASEVIQAIKNHQNKQPERALALKDFMCAIISNPAWTEHFKCNGDYIDSKGIAGYANQLTESYIEQLNK